MSKLNYITRQLSRAERKPFEHYVVTRIYHLLNDLEIKFITQQYVVRPDKRRALTDIFFPQFGIHVEVDELFHLNQKEPDLQREADIVNATSHRFLRVDVSSMNAEVINSRIDEIVTEIRSEKIRSHSFKPWNIEIEQDPKTYINLGYIKIEDDVAFRKSVDALNCFGYNFVGFQRGGANHPSEPGKLIWFPKLYENNGWNNQISSDDLTISESSKNFSDGIEYYNTIKNSTFHKRIVFARVRSPLGEVMYRFKGEYQLDQNASTDKTGLIWRRVSTQVKTYKPNVTGSPKL